VLEDLIAATEHKDQSVWHEAFKELIDLFYNLDSCRDRLVSGICGMNESTVKRFIRSLLAYREYDRFEHQVPLIKALERFEKSSVDIILDSVESRFEEGLLWDSIRDYAVIIVLGKIGDVRAVKPLARFLEIGGGSSSIREDLILLAADALSSLGRMSMTEDILTKKLLETDDYESISLAVRTLCHMGWKPKSQVEEVRYLFTLWHLGQYHPYYFWGDPYITGNRFANTASQAAKSALEKLRQMDVEVVKLIYEIKGIRNIEFVVKPILGSW